MAPNGTKKLERIVKSGSPSVLVVDSDDEFKESAKSLWGQKKYGFDTEAAEVTNWFSAYEKLRPQIIFLSSEVFPEDNEKEQSEILKTIDDILANGTEVVVTYRRNEEPSKLVRESYEKGKLEMHQKSYEDAEDNENVIKTAEELGSFGKKLAAEIRERGDIGLSLWMDFKLRERAFTQNNNSEDYEAAKVALRRLYGMNEKGLHTFMFVEHTDDSAAGAFTTIEPLDVLRPYSTVDRGWAIRGKATINEAQQNYADSEHAKKLAEAGGTFRLAEVSRPYIFDDEDFALTVSQLIIGPELDIVSRLLRSDALEEDQVAKKIRESLLAKNIRDIVYWQQNFGEVAKRQSPEEILNYYASNIVEGFRQANNFTYKKRIMPIDCIFADEELELLDETITKLLIRHLTLDKNTIARIMDNSTHNSGVELGVMRAPDRELWKAIRDTLVKNDKVDYDAVQSRYAHWDPASGKFGHFLEDFFHMADSFSIGLGPKQRYWRMGDFIRRKFGEEHTTKEFEIDAAIMGFYRNLRKRALVIGKYAARNEQRYKVGAKDENSAAEKRKDYMTKSAHYAARADEHLSELSVLLQKKFNGDIPNDQRTVIDEIARMRNTRPLDTEKLAGIKNLLDHSEDAVSSAAMMAYVQHLTRRAGYFNRIHFNRLMS